MQIELKSLRVDKIKPNPWNPNKLSAKTYAKLKSDIKSRGFVSPITVRASGDVWEIVDGEHRWRIMSELGADIIPAVVVEMDDDEAKLKTMQLNYMRGTAVPAKLAALLAELNKTMSLPELAERLPYSELQLQDSLALLKLPPEYSQMERQQVTGQAPKRIHFILYPDQIEIVERALDHIANMQNYAKNPRGMALEMMAADYLAGADTDG
jgi:ParB family chromosome partitioning protein